MSLVLHIKSPALPDTDLNVNGTETVNDIIAMLRDKHSLKGKHLRLIHMGRVLDPVKSLAMYRIPAGAFIHCAVNDGPSASAPVTAPPPRQAVRSAVGFERLQEGGLSAADVEMIRLQFHMLRGSGPLLIQARHNPRVDARLREEEEAWMDASAREEEREYRGVLDLEMGGYDESFHDPLIGGQSVEGHSLDFVCGMMLGLFLGVLALLFLLDRSVPRRRWQGIAVGVFMSTAVVLLQFSGPE